MSRVAQPTQFEAVAPGEVETVFLPTSTLVVGFRVGINSSSVKSVNDETSNAEPSDDESPNDESCEDSFDGEVGSSSIEIAKGFGIVIGSDPDSIFTATDPSPPGAVGFIGDCQPGVRTGFFRSVAIGPAGIGLAGIGLGGI